MKGSTYTAKISKNFEFDTKGLGKFRKQYPNNPIICYFHIKILSNKIKNLPKV